MEAELEYPRRELTIREIDDSQLVAAVDGAVETSSAAGAVTGKRKRGRPPRGQQRLAPPPPMEKEEDVCFICFDGGSLVLCDRKGCPKAYHPACIKRDEAFFQSTAKWNCGWHICSTCQKASSYMCYTCTYSLCKGCIKNADYACLRGNRGLCGACMRTIMLIENVGPASKEKVQVDFDDKTSWEYLFKVYWVCLKNELSLTSDELNNAQYPWKGDDLAKARNLWNGAHPITSPVVELRHSSIEQGSKINNHMQLVNKENSFSMERSITDKRASLPPQDMAWATKELLEFVAYMKNGDVSALSQFDVQTLLLDYIKGNNLQDPHQKSQIVCDSRLITLFGKARMGHFEMLKLLKYHFLVGEKSSIKETVRAVTGDAVSSSLRAAECSNTQVITSSDRRRESQINPNLDGCAAIDVHNVNLLYLKRSSVENLLDDADKFHDTVVGSFVRIKISGGDQKVDAYRLVQVVGTGMAVEVYTVGSRTTDLMLEILNLDCKEIVSVDGISNQDFSEDECRRLRQTIKCGLIKPLTVGEILAKAMMLQAAKVSDVLEAEILRLNHLLDQASKKGQQQQLQECIEKLEILKSPKERQRRLLEIPKVHADPKMDPNYESEEDPVVNDEKKPGTRGRPRKSGRGRKIVNPSIMLRGVDNLNDKGNRAQARRAVTQSETCLHIVSGLLASAQNRPAVVQSETSSQVVPMILTSNLPNGDETFANDAEDEKLWHYQDPTGKIQGPFAMMQLRKWSSSGLFPLDLRVWRTYEQQNDSILLTEALVGQFCKEPSFLQEVFSSSTNNDQRSESGLNLNQSTDTTSTDSKNVESNCKSVRDKTSSELLSKIFGCDSPSWTTSVTVAPIENGQAQSSLQGLDASKNSNSWTDEPQIGSKNAPSPSSGKFCEIPSPQASKDDEDEKLSSDFSHVKSTIIHVEGRSNAVGPEEKRVEGEVYSSHSPGQNWGPLSMNSPSRRWASNSGVSPEKNVEKLKQNQEIDFIGLPSTAEHSKEGSKGQLVENIQASPNVPVQDSGASWSTASSLVVGGQLREVGSEWCGYSAAPAKPSVDEWDSSVVRASSLKPTEAASDHAGTPSSARVQLAQCAETHITIDAGAWQPMMTEGHETEFSLVDESVSDLLAEVEAMESLGGLPSPTSRMTCAADMTHASDNDCFVPGEEFSPLPGQGKNDALNSSRTMQLPSHFAVVHEMPPPLSGVQHRASKTPTVSHEVVQSGDAFVRKSFGGHSSDRAKVEPDKKPDVSVGLWQAGSDVQPIASSNFPLGKSSTGGHRSASHQDASGSVEGNTNLSLNLNLNRGPPAKDNNTTWGTGHVSVQHQGSMAMTSPTGNPSSRGGHSRQHNGDRSSGTRDNRSSYYQGRDSGSVRDMSSSWNRQPSGGAGNGGHSFRPPSKGPRICKFYESGFCRKGASCSYWHPGS